MLRKLFIAIIFLFLLLAAGIVSIPFLFRDKIAEAVRAEINNRLNATVSYADFDLSVIRSFPNLHFSLNDFSMVCKAPFPNDTLLHIKKFGLVLDVMSVWKGEQYKVTAVSLLQPSLHAYVDRTGKANWEIFKDEPADNNSSPLNLNIRSIEVKDGQLVYDDRKADTRAAAAGLNYSGSADVSGELYDMDVDLHVPQLTYQSGLVTYLKNASVRFKSVIKVDNIQSKYSLLNASLALNDLKLKLDGWVKNGKQQTDMDLTFAAAETEFKQLLSLIPAIYSNDFSKLQASGKLKLDGSVKGSMRNDEYPAATINLAVRDGRFRYPSLPSEVKDVQIQMSYQKPQGTLNRGVIDVSKLHLMASGNPLDAKIRVSTPVTDPDVQAMVKGRIDLKTVSAFYPATDIRKLEGIINTDIDFRGRKSDLDNKRYDVVKADGTLNATGIVYDSKANPSAVYVPVLSMTFNPQNVTVNNCMVRIGKSDFKATGYVDNFIGYVFGKGNLIGKLQLQSNLLDANEFLQKNADGTQKTDTAATDYFRVPRNIRITTDAVIGTLPYEKMVLRNVRGQVRIQDEQIVMQQLSAEVFKGKAVIDGYYSTQKEGKPEAHLTYTIQEFDITELYKTVGLGATLAPVMKYLSGTISSDMKLDMSLKPDMSIDYSTLNGDGKVSIPYARIVNMPLLQEINRVVKTPLLSNPELKNAWTIVRFSNGRVNVDPTDFKFGNGYNVNVSGWNSFEKAIDFTMRLDVPGKDLAPATSLVQQYIPKVPGVNFSMPDVLNVFMKATGTVEKPVVTLQRIAAGGGKSIQDALADKAKEEAKRLEEEAKQKAQAEADRLKKQAEEKAKAEADKLKKQTEEKLKKEAGKKVKDILKWPK